MKNESKSDLEIELDACIRYLKWSERIIAGIMVTASLIAGYILFLKG